MHAGAHALLQAKKGNKQELKQLFTKNNELQKSFESLLSSISVGNYVRETLLNEPSWLRKINQTEKVKNILQKSWTISVKAFNEGIQNRIKNTI